MNGIRTRASSGGNEELVFSPVAAVVVIRDSKQLLLYRKPGSDVWELPGGAARRGETLEQTARRELAAQTGVHAGELEVWKVFCTPELPAPEGEGEQVQEVVGVFCTEISSGTQCESKVQSRQIEWREMHDLPPLHPTTSLIIKQWMTRTDEEKAAAARKSG
ncbi:NUDIX domain-containing protein [Paenibacillus larvae]|uniref:NUDIX domain-containing protein n=1 Tax=Paenibacillus larvae TaxID=1464 RepID=A0AAP5JUB2_9BACL|nr:NUDIX domain-containing protein [Paenibacillus larvae]AQR78233.1 hypothetical protein BXP28_13800 [Paenibacillus larvae subsp. larvae]MDT2246881.1 NUDIX domain-containing protein [Paenibacillus larvae]MDT2252067.1 NUDIX domain-containing protein [Paenibacillus larvae]MDT2267683.1 NUDIX domain-containing protein [Paenibacillus larvae]MDT2286883.1 NUDIX domain-containing protein [Paenibacillus larvae]